MSYSPERDEEFPEETEDEPVRASSSRSWWRRRARPKPSKAVISSLFHGDARSSDILKDIHHFPLEKIRTATNNFALKNRIIGQMVYDVNDGDYVNACFDDYLIDKGSLGNYPSGVEYPIAVRRFETSKWCPYNIQNEISILTGLEHANIARLLGYSQEQNEFMLIYEYSPNKNVKEILFGLPMTKQVLDWKDRYNMCLGIAKGLAHLHEQIKIIHRDIRTANIFHNDSFNPKITGFSLAKRARDDMIDSSSRRIAGTIGYFDPEFVKSGKLTEKVDVYSYGVVILEFVSGKRCVREDVCQLHETLDKQGDPLQFVDQRLVQADFMEKASVLLKLSAMCTNIPSEQRPEMTKVVTVLEGEIDKKEMNKERVMQSDVDEDGDVRVMDCNPTTPDAKEELINSSKVLLKKMHEQRLLTEEYFSHEGEALPFSKDDDYRHFENLVRGNSLEEALSKEIKPKILHLCKILDGLPESLLHYVKSVKYLLESTSHLSSVRTEYSLCVDAYERVKVIVEQLQRGNDADASITLQITPLENWLAAELRTKDAAEKMLNHLNETLQWKMKDWNFMQENFRRLDNRNL